MIPERIVGHFTDGLQKVICSRMKTEYRNKWLKNQKLKTRGGGINPF
jgi:hypothetical protein